MYTANLFDRDKGITRLMPFRSMKLCLAYALRMGTTLLTVMSGVNKYQCRYDSKNGWVIK